jgi:anti-sigma regulatory factor (Ser/Thr protein kinase)
MPYHRCPACSVTSYCAATHATARVCASCAAPLGEATKLFVAPGATHNLRRALRARPQAAAEARQAVRSLALPEATRQTLALIVSELVTNSILHADLTAGDTVDMHVEHGAPQVRLTVHDSGPGFAPPSASPDTLEIGGQGLVITAALSDSWGVDCDDDGCSVWCEMPVDATALTSEHDVTGAYVRELALEMARPAAPIKTPQAAT